MTDWFKVVRETIARNEKRDPNFYRDPDEPSPSSIMPQLIEPLEIMDGGDVLFLAPMRQYLTINEYRTLVGRVELVRDPDVGT